MLSTLVFISIGFIAMWIENLYKRNQLKKVKEELSCSMKERELTESNLWEIKRTASNSQKKFNELEADAELDAEISLKAINSLNNEINDLSDALDKNAELSSKNTTRIICEIAGVPIGLSAIIAFSNQVNKISIKDAREEMAKAIGISTSSLARVLINARVGEGTKKKCLDFVGVDYDLSTYDSSYEGSW